MPKSGRAREREIEQGTYFSLYTQVYKNLLSSALLTATYCSGLPCLTAHALLKLLCVKSLYERGSYFTGQCIAMGFFLPAESCGVSVVEFKTIIGALYCILA